MRPRTSPISPRALSTSSTSARRTRPRSAANACSSPRLTSAMPRRCWRSSTTTCRSCSIPVLGELAERRINVFLVAHPVLRVVRENGRLIRLGEGERESFIHLHLDGVTGTLPAPRSRRRSRPCSAKCAWRSPTGGRCASASAASSRSSRPIRRRSRSKRSPKRSNSCNGCSPIISRSSACAITRSTARCCGRISTRRSASCARAR